MDYVDYVGQILESGNVEECILKCSEWGKYGYWYRPVWLIMLKRVKHGEAPDPGCLARLIFAAAKLSQELLLHWRRHGCEGCWCDLS